MPARRQAEFHAFPLRTLPAGPAAIRAPALHVEALLSAGGADVELAQHLGRLAPFGTANEEPVVAVPNVRVTRADRLGNDGNTLRAYVQTEGDRVA